MKCRFINRQDGRAYNVRYVRATVAPDGSVTDVGTLSVYKVIDCHENHAMMQPQKEIPILRAEALKVLDELAENAHDKTVWTTFFADFGVLISDGHIAHRMTVEARERYRQGEIRWEL